MKAPLFDKNGKQKGTVDLEASHFGVAPNSGLIHRLLILQQSNGRIAIAHTKTRGEVKGSTKKLFRQKGTGNARVGDRRSPIRRGGGVTFGPRNNRNFSIDMNRQERRLALLSLLSTKANSECVKVIESFESANKTKNVVSIMKEMSAKKPLFAITRDEKNSVLGAYNVVNSRVVNVEYLNPHDLLKYNDVIFSEASLKHLYNHFAK